MVEVWELDLNNYASMIVFVKRLKGPIFRSTLLFSAMVLPNTSLSWTGLPLKKQSLDQLAEHSSP
jgi:hypothetical protein